MSATTDATQEGSDAAPDGADSAADANDASPSASLTDKQRRILSHLRERVGAKRYFKSRLIASELGMTAKEVGTNMVAIRDGDFDVEVSEWGYSSSTTWEVTAAD